MSNPSSRRLAIKNIVAGTAVLGTAGMLSSFDSPEEANSLNMAFKGNINHSVCRWCYGDIPLDQLCKAVKKIGFSAIDLVGPKDWPVLQQHGILAPCAMVRRSA